MFQHIADAKVLSFAFPAALFTRLDTKSIKTNIHHPNFTIGTMKGTYPENPVTTGDFPHSARLRQKKGSARSFFISRWQSNMLTCTRCPKTHMPKLWRRKIEIMYMIKMLVGSLQAYICRNKIQNIATKRTSKAPTAWAAALPSFGAALSHHVAASWSHAGAWLGSMSLVDLGGLVRCESVVLCRSYPIY